MIRRPGEKKIAVFQERGFLINQVLRKSSVEESIKIAAQETNKILAEKRFSFTEHKYVPPAK